MLRSAAAFQDRDAFDRYMSEVRAHAYTLDIDTHNAELLFAVKSSDKAGVLHTLSVIKSAGLEYNARTYAVLLEKAVMEKDPDEVLRVLHALTPVKDFEFTSVSVLSHALMLLARPAYLTRLHTVVLSIANAYKRGVPLPLETVIIEALSDAGDSESALKRFFRVLSNAPFAAADPLYAAAFRVCGKVNDVAMAVSLFEERRLLRAPHSPSLRLYAALLSACVAGGRKDLARKYGAEVQGAFPPELLVGDVRAAIQFGADDVKPAIPSASATNSNDTPPSASAAPDNAPATISLVSSDKDHRTL